MKKNILTILIGLVLSSCATHSGNVSTGSFIDCPHVNVISGSASATYYLGLGGLSKEALIQEAKKDLQANFPYKKKVAYSNYSVDFKHTYFFLIEQLLVTVSADVFDCNEYPLDTNAKNQVQKLIINGFKIGDSIYYRQSEYLDEYYKGIVTNFNKDRRIVIEIEKNQPEYRPIICTFDKIYAASSNYYNKNIFGFDVNESASIQVYNSKSNTIKLKPCKIIAININQALIEYENSEGKITKIFIEKRKLKTNP